MSTLQERWIGCEGSAWRWKRENFRRFRIGGITCWRLVPNARRIDRIIGNDSWEAMGMIQAQCNWVPYKLKPRDVEQLFFAWEQLIQRQNRKGFNIALWPAPKNGFTAIISNAENYRELLDMPPRWRPDRIFTMPRLCSAFGGTTSRWYIMSYWNRVKPSQGIGIKWNYCIWVEN